jgi:hypothetical protein
MLEALEEVGELKDLKSLKGIEGIAGWLWVVRGKVVGGGGRIALDLYLKLAICKFAKGHQGIAKNRLPFVKASL